MPLSGVISSHKYYLPISKSSFYCKPVLYRNYTELKVVDRYEEQNMPAFFNLQYILTFISQLPVKLSFTDLEHFLICLAFGMLYEQKIPRIR